MRRVVLLVLVVLSVACRNKPRKSQDEVEQARLTSLIERAELITVSNMPYGHEGAKVIWVSSARSDIEELKEAATFLWPPESHCLCLGYPAIRLYRRQDEILSITSFDWKTIRWQTPAEPIWHDNWQSTAVPIFDDVRLKDPKKWRRWFESRNIPTVAPLE